MGKEIARYIFWVFVITAMGCGKQSACVKTTGNIQTYVREIPAFKKLTVYDKIHIALKPSTVNKITVQCGANLADYIVTEVVGDNLTIRNDNKCNFLRSYKKQIHVVLEYTSLSHIHFVGAGNVMSTDTLIQPYLEITAESSSGDFDLMLHTDSTRITLHTGNSNAHLSGKTGDLFLYSGGTCIVNAQTLKAKACYVNNSGTGDFSVNAIDYLFAVVNGEGSIFYSGNPFANLSDNGKGSITHK